MGVQRVIMAGWLRNSRVLLITLAFTFLSSITLPSQIFKTLYNFTGLNAGNSDLAIGSPLSGVILVSNTLYGTTHITHIGGTYGSVYAVNTDGTGFRIISTFSEYEGEPRGTFVISDNILYTAGDLGAVNGGSIIEVPIDGTNELPSNWYDFASVLSDGTLPDGLILSDGILFGVTRYGGKGGHGTIYSYDGATVTYLYAFVGSDGANPNGSLVLYNGTLYGVTRFGGTWGNGTIYTLNVDGSGFKTLHHFGGPTNGEGANPLAELILWDDTLFGTTSSGGAFTNGTVFSLNTNGTSFTTLYSFTGGRDGFKPSAGLNLSGNTIYRTTTYSWASGLGTIFAVGTDGSGFTTLHSFKGGDGADPLAKMFLFGNTLYGTTYYDGSSGTIFSLWLGVPPQLTITSSGSNVVLTWPTNGNFFLQSSTNLLSPPVWTGVSAAPVVVNGQNTVTNLIFGTQQFYRLSQ